MEAAKETSELEANKRVMRRFYEETLKPGGINRIGEFVAPSLLEQMKEHIRAVCSTYPDLYPGGWQADC